MKASKRAVYSIPMSGLDDKIKTCLYCKQAFREGETWEMIGRPGQYWVGVHAACLAARQAGKGGKPQA